MKRIKAPLEKKEIEKLKAGDEVLLSGTIYTARDQAHRRLVEVLRSGRKPPIDLKGAVIYYCGPTNRKPGKVIGSCGPTTSARMDAFAPALLAAGAKALIGKGGRCAEVVSALKRHQAVYFLAYAGCAALLSKYVISAKPVAYKDLGPEAILELEVKDFPLLVGIDIKGNDVYSRFNVIER